MKITILEEALEAGHGHWPSYIGGMARDWRSGGDTVDILAHRHASPDLLAVLGADPVFRRSCWTDTRSQGAWGGLVHNLFFYQDALPRLNQAQPSDWVLSLTTRTQHLLAFAALARRTPRSTRFLLLFVQGFGLFQGEYLPVHFPATASPRFARFCFDLLAPEVRRGKVFLAAETAAMRSELESFTHLPVHHFPHPVPTPSQPWGAPTEPNPFVLVCPGFARHEKGSDLLLEAMPRLLSGPWSQRVRFVLQWPEPFRLPDGSWCTPSEALRRDRRVEFIDRPLDEVAYQNLLGRTHALLLPYRLNSYHNRISRVALEGAARGIPLVFTQGTSPQELHLPADAYVTCRDNDSGSLADSIESLLARWPSAERVARRSASAIADLHSANRFRRQLQALDEVPS